jgi:hypothetical protein
MTFCVRIEPLFLVGCRASKIVGYQYSKKTLQLSACFHINGVGLTDNNKNTIPANSLAYGFLCAC